MKKKTNSNTEYKNLKTKIDRLKKENQHQLEGISRALSNLRFDVRQLKIKDQSRRPLKERITTLLKKVLINLIIIFPITGLLTINLENILATKYAPLDYSFEDYRVTYDPTSIISLDENKESEYKHDFVVDTLCTVSSGEINKLYIVYTQDDSSYFSEKNFHPIELDMHTSVMNWVASILPLPSNWKNKIPIINNFNNISKSQISFRLSFGSYEKITNKNIYLLTLDNQQNISINILNVESTAQFQQNNSTDISATLKIIPRTGKDPQFTMISLDNLLTDNKLSDNVLEKYKNDLNQILEVFGHYTIINKDT
ncbi:hypothetical protein G8C15_17555 [Enterococcus casseliflavus]|nr:hypothetical protein [Enterococcus casseliflavus]